jgi:DNA-directed DNA polymerase III PolC
MFIHLNTHSAYSLLRGLPLPVELAQAAHAAGMPALALTDYRTLTGAVEFVRACHDFEVRPLLGLDLETVAGKLTLLAADAEGWSNLCRLSSAAALAAPEDTRCSLDQLNTFAPGLIAIASGNSHPEALKEIYTGALYLGMSDPQHGVELSRLAAQLSLPTVAHWPIYFLRPDQASLQRTLTSIRTLQPLDKLSPQACASADAFFASEAEMEKRFQHFPKALENTLSVAERCQFELPLGVPHMPTVALPAGQTPTQALRLKAEAGARQLYGQITPEIQAHLDHEIEVISTMGFEPIFLIVEDILNFARQQGIPYSSRGSAASSLVAHCLGITSPDPLRLNLYFERFLNSARSTPPDIDTDLCSRRRDEVIEHVFATYGADRVAMVATINRFRPRSALNDVAKAHGLSSEKIRAMTAQLPHAFWARMESTQTSEEPINAYAELSSTYAQPIDQQIFSEAAALLKLPRHLSVHAGGLIVAPGKLTDLVPVMRSGNKGMLITQFDLDSLEALGLVKIDLLGIRGLTVLGDIGEFIQQKKPAEYTTRLAVLDAVPKEDTATSDRIETGQTIGCFQIESPGMRTTLREIHARTEDDLMAALALYRPGPLKGGLKDAFVRRFQGKEPVLHIHPALAPYLDHTFGVILYQEQVLRIAHEIAGFSLADADLLRRAMSHFDSGGHMKELQQKFVNEALAKSNIPIETGERLWEMMAAFSGYGFPQAHAASYAQVAWRSAWCKTHFPAEFMAAVLANWGGYYSQRVYLSEARRLGLTVHPPHVNHSSRNFIAEKNSQDLYMGLDQVKGLTHRTLTRILQYRPFHTLEEFLSQVDPRPVEAECLARVDAFHGMLSIPAALKRLQQGSWSSGQMSLFSWETPALEDWDLAQKAAAQEEILGLSVESHPLDLIREKIQAVGAITIMEALEQIGHQVTVVGVRQASHRSRTARGETMMFLTLEDLTGLLDTVLFPDVYRSARTALHEYSAPVLITGVIEMDSSTQEPFLRAEKVLLMK